LNPNQLMQQLIEEQKIAGAVLRVRQKGQIIFDEAQGYADLSAKRTADADTIYRLASMSKPVTGIAIMQLVEQGRLKLEDPLERFLPAYSEMLVANKANNPDKPEESALLDGFRLEAARRPITIGMMLNHSSGLGHAAMGTWLIKSPLIFQSLKQTANQMAHVPLDFHPGEGTGYSALFAFDLLGRVVEIVSGQSFDDYLNEHLFKPLGIRDVCYLPDHGQQTRIARIYSCSEGRAPIDMTDDPSENLLRIDPLLHGYFSGAGGLYGSLNAYERIALALLNNGTLDGVKILKPETVRQMATPYDEQVPIPGMRWGLSVAVYDGTGRSRWIGPGSFGWSGGFGTHFYVDPGHELVMTLMINQTNMVAINPVFLAVEEAVYRTFVGTEYRGLRNSFE